MTASEARAAYLPAATWSYPDAILALVAGFAAALVAGAVVVTATGSTEVGVLELSVTLVAQSAASLAVIAWMSQTRGTGRWADDFGFCIRWSDAWGIAVGLGLQVVAALVIGPIVELFAPEGAPRQEVAEVAQRTGRGAGSLVFILLVVGVAPIVEEVIFRGMLLSRLRRTMSAQAAIAWSAAAFAGIHLLDPNALYAVPGLFFVGIALGWLALRGGDLSVPIFVHAGVNLTGALVLIFSDELADAAVRVGALFVF